MEQEFDLRYYLAIIRKWWWILALGMLVAVMVSWFSSRSVLPVYQATAKVLVQRSSGSPGISDVGASEQLAAYYSDLIKTRPILQKVVDSLHLPYDENGLAGKILITSPRSLIGITVTDGDPVQAALLANTVATTAMDSIRQSQLLELAQFQASLQQFGINQDPSIVAAQASTLSLLTMAEEAVPARFAANANKSRSLILAGILGLMGGGLVVFLVEHLDTRVKSPDDLKALTKLDILGSILRFSNEDNVSPLVTTNGHHQSAPAESFKFLRTNLQFAALSREGFHSLLVTSAGPGEGKTTTATNLAATFANEGKSVILMDADLRRPSLHRIFGLDRQVGLTNVLLGNVTLDEALQETGVPGLKVLLSGPLPPDPTTVLRSTKVREVIHELARKADYLIIDSPPVLAVADPLVIMPNVDGVLFVVDLEDANRDSVQQAAAALLQGSPGYIAAVLNKVSSKARGGYYYYYYYYYYYGYGENQNGQGRRSRSRSRAFMRAVLKPFIVQSDGRRERTRRAGEHNDVSNQQPKAP